MQNSNDSPSPAHAAGKQDTTLVASSTPSEAALPEAKLPETAFLEAKLPESKFPAAAFTDRGSLGSLAQRAGMSATQESQPSAEGQKPARSAFGESPAPGAGQGGDLESESNARISTESGKNLTGERQQAIQRTQDTQNALQTTDIQAIPGLPLYDIAGNLGDKPVAAPLSAVLFKSREENKGDNKDGSKGDTQGEGASRTGPVVSGSSAQGQGHNAQQGEYQLTPSEVDFLPPLIQSLSTLFRLTGKRVSGKHLLTALGNNAPSPASCRRAAKALGLDLRLVHREQIDDILPVVLPCMLLLSRNRSAILTAFEGDKVCVVMPEFGHEPLTLLKEDLDKDYTGYALFVTPDPEETREKATSVPTITRWFWDVVLHYKPLFRQVLVVSVVINLLALMGPLFFMNVYDRVVPNLAMDTLWVLGVGIITGYIFECGLRILRDTFTNTASRNIDTVLGTQIMDHILGMRLEDRPASSGELINNLRESETLREFFSATTLLALVDLPFLIFFLFIVLLIGGVLVIIPLVAVVVLLIWVTVMQSAIRSHAARMHRSNVEKNSHMVEMVSGIEAIKMASAQSRMLHIWETVVGRAAATSATAKRITTTAVSSAMLITHLVSVSLIIWGVYLIGEHKLSTGGLIACNMLVGRAMSFVVQLATLMTRMQQARTAFRVLNELMALPPEDSHAPNVEFGYLPHSMEMEEVSFTYRGANLPSLHSLNLQIKPGEKVGVMGNMGSGKSTFMRLLAGLYQPTEGSVKFGGVDLRQLDLMELRTRMGFLPQEPLLFQGTIRDNIALGTPHVPDQLILRAAWIAGVADFARRHPSGYGLSVGERGQNLSGGQRQAVALARALLHDPDIVLLDEPTSNIDGLTEARIRQRLKSIMAAKTLVVSMHRTSLLDLVDRLIVFKQGRIIADGPKDEVLKNLNKSSGGSEKVTG